MVDHKKKTKKLWGELRFMQFHYVSIDHNLAVGSRIALWLAHTLHIKFAYSSFQMSSPIPNII